MIDKLFLKDIMLKKPSLFFLPLLLFLSITSCTNEFEVNRIISSSGGSSVKKVEVDEDTSSTISLDYLGSSDVIATSCSVSNLQDITVSTACSCDISGSCTVEVIGDTNFSGEAGFSYSIFNGSELVTSSVVIVNILQVDDAPVTNNISPSSFSENTESIITLNYSDIESDEATSCSVSSLTNVVESTACSCTNGTCSVGVTGTTNYFGTASFDYSVTANSEVSNTSTATLSITTEAFVSKWETTSPSESITLPIKAGYSYNAVIDWGDSSATETLTTDTPPSHTYASAGEYTIRITGTMEAWSFSNSGDKDKIIEVNNFGNLGWKDLRYAFYGCSNLELFNGGITDSVTDMYGMFYNTNGLTSIDVSSFDTSSVTTMARMFAGLTSLNSLDLSNFNTTSVDSMQEMFKNSSGLTALDLSSFNTSSVESMKEMFKNVSSLSSLDISTFNTSIVENMSEMFRGTNFTEQPNWSNNFTTASVTNMTGMFQSAKGMSSLDLSNFNTSSVMYMTDMFRDATNLTSLNLSSFNTSSVISMSNMFYDATGLTSITWSSGTNAENVLYMNDMFYNCSSLTSLDLSSFNTSKVTTMSGMFNRNYLLTSLDLTSFNTSEVTDMSSMFFNSESLTSLDLSHFNTSKVSDLSTMFYGTDDLVSINLRTWDITSVSNSLNIFQFSNAGLTLACNNQDAVQDGTGVNATGTFFGENCN
ncbi:BspA family leucine-rich repeat surface protein [Halobacteriovorax sp.]|uniref:BspA family leucine-rich repeat surface protein n=1 Tax=Halobacteriovorax sp. TaxID=2020862 RepID=UPI0035639DF9